VGLAGFGQDCFEVLEDFFDAHGVDFTAGVVAFFNDGFEVVAGDLCCQLVGDDLAGALLLFDPGVAGEGDPHGPVVYVEADIDGVGVAGGDGHDVGFPAAVEVFAGPAVGYVEVFVHAFSVMAAIVLSKDPERAGICGIPPLSQTRRQGWGTRGPELKAKKWCIKRHKTGGTPFFVVYLIENTNDTLVL